MSFYVVGKNFICMQSMALIFVLTYPIVQRNPIISFDENPERRR